MANAAFHSSMRHMAAKSTLSQKYAEQREFHQCRVPHITTDHSSLDMHPHCRSANRHANGHTHPCVCISTRLYNSRRINWFVFVHNYSKCVIANGWVSKCVLQTVRQSKVMSFIWSSSNAYAKNLIAARYVCFWRLGVYWIYNDNLSFFLFIRLLQSCWYCTVRVQYAL